MISSRFSAYRYLFCRKGYGIHSPFVYDFVTNVIEEKRPYYCYERLSEKYLALKTHNSKSLPGRKEYELLFRAANKIKPQNCLVIADDEGLSALYATAFSDSAQCVAMKRILPHNCKNQKYDLIVCRHFTREVVFKLMEYTKDDTLMIVSGIRNSDLERKLWHTLCAHPKVSVTIDIRNTGCIFFHPQLHRKTYKSIL
ncbi:MAG: hypothetical protein LBD80_05600 [Tannerella sp.]|jgi:hypothetical protein|nr:hypothetical protein [Tannerella sp.]